MDTGLFIIIIIWFETDYKTSLSRVESLSEAMTSTLGKKRYTQTNKQTDFLKYCSPSAVVLGEEKSDLIFVGTRERFVVFMKKG